MPGRRRAFAGTFPYTVDGTVHASIVVVPEGRAIYLVGKSHTIKRGASLNVHGELDVPILSPPVPPAPQPITDTEATYQPEGRAVLGSGLEQVLPGRRPAALSPRAARDPGACARRPSGSRASAGHEQ